MKERFKIQRLIGKSATGGIYIASDSKNGKKILLQRFYSENGNTSTLGWDYIFRDIMREWKLIKHPGILKLHEADIDEDGAYMSLHYFESEPLILHFTTLMSFEELINFATQATSVLNEIHSKNIVHGALSPNSFLVSKETLRQKQYFLADLSLSQLVPRINRSYAKGWLPSDPAILAPEIFEGHKPLDVTDVYMLGHIFYYMVLGAHPLADLTLEEAERRHFAHEMPRLDEVMPAVPEEIATWIQGMMLPHPDDRTESMAEVINSIPDRSVFILADQQIKAHTATVAHG